MRNKLLLIFLLVPLIVPIGLTIYHANHSAEEWRLPVRGYDPRDLLRGRYIQFRYDFGNIQDSMKVRDFICLSGDKKNPTITKAVSGPCDQKIKVYNSMLGQQKFYIPEAIANEADKLVRGNIEGISVGVVIIKDGLRPSTLYYQDKNLIDYLKNR